MIQAIHQRRSIRTYQKKPLSSEDLALIQTLMGEYLDLKGPFQHGINLFHYNMYEPLEEKIKIGTYGFISNAPYFLGATTINTFEGLIDFGYLFEQIILKLTKHNLGTVWLGGTFQRKALDITLGENELIPAITPIGYPKNHTTLRDKLIRYGAKADNRKTYQELFYEHDFDYPINENMPLNYSMFPYLKLVQLAPSASNKQPWRIVLEEDKAHFYLERTPNYASMLSFDIQAIDIGIAIAHFEIGLQTDDIPYKIYKDEERPNTQELDYVLSFSTL